MTMYVKFRPSGLAGDDSLGFEMPAFDWNSFATNATGAVSTWMKAKSTADYAKSMAAVQAQQQQATQQAMTGFQPQVMGQPQIPYMPLTQSRGINPALLVGGGLALGALVLFMNRK